MTTIPTSPSFSLTSSTMATTFTLMSQDEGTWSPGQLVNKMAGPPGGSVGPCMPEQQELRLQRGAQDRGSRSNQVTTISSYPSPSLTSFTIAATFILVSQAETL